MIVIAFWFVVVCRYDTIWRHIFTHFHDHDSLPLHSCLRTNCNKNQESWSDKLLKTMKLVALQAYINQPDLSYEYDLWYTTTSYTAILHTVCKFYWNCAHSEQTTYPCKTIPSCSIGKFLIRLIQAGWRKSLSPLNNIQCNKNKIIVSSDASIILYLDECEYMYVCM